MSSPTATEQLLSNDGPPGRPESWADGIGRWAAGRRAPSAAGVLVWFIPLVIGPVTGAVDARQWWLAWPTLALASACWFVAIGSAFRAAPQPRRAALALTLMAAVTVAAVIGFDDAWAPLFVLCAIGIGATVRTRYGVPAVLAITVTAAGSAWLSTGAWDATWTTALPTFLAGLSTFWFCQLLAVIAELARTRQELADVAVSQERLRFSRDLHDLLGHTLSVIVVKAEVVRRLTDSDEAAAHAADIEAIGRGALAEVRQAASSYRGLTLSGELARARLALDAVDVELTTRLAATTLPRPVDELFGWVVRESVTNVIRHSAAGRCTITVSTGPGSAQIEVYDDGPHAVVTEPGAGLTGLRERAEAAQAELDVRTGPDGLTVAVRAPVAG